jgi:small nuclear ribonucleoprotein (snRNP)-like protein
MANLGVPIKLLHEALGHVVTCELKTGQVSRACVDGCYSADRVVRRSCIEELCSKVRSPPSPLPPLLSAYRRSMFANAHHPSTAEDSCNISLREITVTARDGRVSQLEQVYIRGSMVRYFIVPDMLANAPM